MNKSAFKPLINTFIIIAIMVMLSPTDFNLNRVYIYEGNSVPFYSLFVNTFVR